MLLGAVIVFAASLIVFNYFRTPKQVGQVPTDTTGSQVEFKESPIPVEKKHTVIKGESLWQIAESVYGSGFYYKDIAQANKLTNASKIEVGQELLLPEISQPQTSGNQPISEKITSQAEPISGASYTVVKGDSLWKISVRAYGDGYKWVTLAKENKLVHPNLIHPGNVLSLPR